MLPIKMQHLRYTNIAGYLQWSAAWHNMLSTTVALRYDANSRYKGTFNPTLGLVFKPTDKITSKFLEVIFYKRVDIGTVNFHHHILQNMEKQIML